jgi:hypothetical protein
LLGNFYKENEHLFSNIVSSNITPEEIAELMRELANAVIMENDVARTSSKKSVSS